MIPGRDCPTGLGLFWGASASLARLGVTAGARQSFPVGGLAMEALTLAVGTLAVALVGCAAQLRDGPRAKRSSPVPATRSAASPGRAVR
ncbi:hypothetical protein AB0I22_07925 [Streptomyces sp. NPDC050610]|uniref:hypothetical protein n=1 Tax=Streptomyces sp. NPDC050610 TaxID=3157097 RepID=UPI00342AA294